MSRTLTRERVRRDIDVLAHAGLDIGTFLDELDVSLHRAIPHVSSCVATVDPATLLLTGTYKFGHLYGKDERDFEWGILEYGHPEETSFTELARGGTDAAGTALVHGGDTSRSGRVRDFMVPQFDYSDELRLVARSGGRVWGGVALFRGEGQSFSADEVDFVASLSTAFATGMRSGLLARIAQDSDPAVHRPGDQGPAVVIVGPDDTVTQMSVGAQARLDEIVNASSSASPIGVVASLVAGARLYASGRLDVLPRSRVRLRTGRWVVINASPLSSPDGGVGDVVVTIEEARPPEIVPIVVEAFGLTARERDVTQLVLQGVETKEIASRLHLSSYTVQDHLKAVFDKADVRSRRELVAKVFFDQYLPRMGAEIGPDGWFLA